MVLRQHDKRVVAMDRRQGRDDRRGAESTRRAGLVARRAHARRVDARPQGAAVPTTARSSCTPTSRRSRPAVQRHGGRPPRPRVRRQLRLRHVRRRAVAQDAYLLAVEPDGRAWSRPTVSASRTARSSRPTARRCSSARAWARRITAFDIAADGTLTNRRLWASLQLDICATSTACASTPTARSGSHARSTDRCVRVAEGGEAPRRGQRPVVARSRACSAARTDARCSSAPPTRTNPTSRAPRRAGASRRSKWTRRAPDRRAVRMPYR